MGAQWINRKRLTQKFVNRHLSATERERVILAVALTPPSNLCHLTLRHHTRFKTSPRL